MNITEKNSVVVRFSGDSGDGMQLAGNIFSTVSATVGNSISTFFSDIINGIKESGSASWSELGIIFTNIGDSVSIFNNSMFEL